MKHTVLLLLSSLGLCSGLLISAESPDKAAAPANPRIDYPGFERLVIESGPVRESHRLTEAEFLATMKRPGVVVLDARTESRFRRLHIAGAVNLPFTEFTAETLAAAIPTLGTPVMIYCNNNFADRLDAFPTKLPVVSLNVSSYTSLRAYGYTRVYELAPLLRVETSRLPFEGDSVRAGAQRGVVSPAGARTPSSP